MNVSKLKIGAATAVTGVSLAAGGLLLGAPWASAQSPPPQPTPQQQQQGTPGQQGTPRNNGTPGQGGQQGHRGQRGSGQDYPKDANGNMLPHGSGNRSGGQGNGSGSNRGGTPGGSGQNGTGIPGGSSYHGGTRSFSQS